MIIGLKNAPSSAVQAWGYFPEEQAFGVIYTSNNDVIYLYQEVSNRDAEKIFTMGKQSIGSMAVPYLKNNYECELGDPGEYWAKGNISAEHRARISEGLKAMNARAWL